MNEMGVTSIANYSCNTGYQPAGDTTVVCMNDGTWSDIPSCQLGKWTVCLKISFVI